MNHFKDKVVVVTGAASGIGKGLARHASQEGMRLVLADVDPSLLHDTTRELQQLGATVTSAVVDVSDAKAVAKLAEFTLDTYGGVHLLFNNAGVGAGTSPWETTLEDWKWVLDVNLGGVIHGIHAFLPIMLEQESESRIVNTSSMAGVVPYHPCAAYHVSKQAVVALTENLHLSLKMRRSRVKTSVLCPGGVNTRILTAERNHPDPSRRQQAVAAGQRDDPMSVMLREAVSAGLHPDEAAAITFAGLRGDKLYIFTDSELAREITRRAESMTLPATSYRPEAENADRARS